MSNHPRFHITTKDVRYAYLLYHYPRSWHKHIKEAFAFRDEACVQELMDNLVSNRLSFA